LNAIYAGVLTYNFYLCFTAGCGQQQEGEEGFFHAIRFWAGTKYNILPSKQPYVVKNACKKLIIRIYFKKFAILF
jgi:uncharacterized UBP type Zn finger protein